MTLQRDQNFRTVGGAVDELGVVTALPIDPSTGRALIQITIESPSVTLHTTAGRDQNHVPTSYGVDENGVITPILTNSNGLILCDITIE
jgi:hypothetical protein